MLGISVTVTHSYLWLRGIRPTRAKSVWDYMTRDMFPKDDKTKHYVAVRTVTGFITLVSTALFLWVAFDIYDAFFPG